MADDRIRGEDVQVLVVSAGELEDTITNIMNFNIELLLEIKKQAYLGQKTEKKDMIFNGVKFDMEVHLQKSAYFAFINKVKAKAKRLQPDLTFNISGIFFFPNGETVPALIPNVAFGAIPLQTANRGDYVKSKLQGESEDMEAVAA